MTTGGAGRPAARLEGVSVVVDGRRILGPLDLAIEPGERWVVMGPNGSGKTTLTSVLSLVRHPSTGSVEVLGNRWGRADVRQVRRGLGVTSATLRQQLHARVTAADVVMTAKNAALEPWWHRYDDDDRRASRAALARLGIDHLAARPIGTLSSGEQQRVLLARALWGEPGLLLLDEPTAGLDIGGRRRLVADLAALAADPTAPPIVLVTHHADEIPDGFTHALLLRDGSVVASGPVGEALIPTNLAACLGETMLGGEVVRSYFEACTAGTAGDIAGHFTDDAVIYDTNHPPVRTAAGIGRFWERIRAKWTGAAWHVDTLVDDGERVAIEWTMTGRDGGRPFSVRGSEHYELRGGRIDQIRQYWTFDPDAPGDELVDYPYGEDPRFA